VFGFFFRLALGAGEGLGEEFVEVVADGGLEALGKLVELGLVVFDVFVVGVVRRQGERLVLALVKDRVLAHREAGHRLGIALLRLGGEGLLRHALAAGDFVDAEFAVLDLP